MSVPSDLLFGVIFLNKPTSITSSEAIQFLRKKIKNQLGLYPKIGHTGTLDKFAEGLLILVLEKSTVFSEIFLKMDKIYIAEIQIGKSTDTLDPDGIILEEWDIYRTKKFISQNRAFIIKQVKEMIHLEEQIPPDYSAIKINGKRASDWKRMGKNVTLPKKRIKIYKSEVLNLSNDGKLKVKFHVSSGTYIRSLAQDLGLKINAPTCLNSLQRISIGNWSIQESYIMDFYNDSIQYLNILDVLQDWEKIYIPENKEKQILNGNKIPLDVSSISTENFFFLNKKNQILAWGKKTDSNQYIYKKVFTIY